KQIIAYPYYILIALFSGVIHYHSLYEKLDLSKKEFMHPGIIEGILQKQNVNLIYVTDMCYTAIC
ncbi:unnamed protein product, partial [Acanthoscelides obtectus]